MNDRAFHQIQYERFGYTVFANAVSDGLVREMATRFRVARNSDLIAGDESNHSWRELSLAAEDVPDEPILGQQVASVLHTEPIRAVHWLNVYEVNEYIGAHVDTGGDAQLMIPIEMPPAGAGGEIWIGARDRLVPLSVGDALLFAAHRIRHGTTTILQGRRISLNVRMWLSDQG